MFQQIKDFVDGKKTYIIGAILFVTGGLQALGYVVPEWVYAVEVSLGLGALRAGVSKTADASK
jgi:hypothetical protein